MLRRLLMWNQLLKMVDMSHGLVVELLIQQRILWLKRVEVCLSLSLGLLIVWIPTAKLSLGVECLTWCHR